MKAKRARTGAVLVLDIGNTSASVALYAGGRVRRCRRLDRADAGPDSMARLLNGLASGVRISGAVMGSVVPRLTPAWKRAIFRETGCRPLEVSCRLELGIPVDYPRPGTIGADRLANAAAASATYGAPVVVADFGTALTFDIIARDRGYIGGIIAPGLPLMLDYLAERTALLPRVRPARPARLVGRSTREAMLSGAHWGYQGLIRELFVRLKGELGRGTTCCATGGYGRWVLAGLDLPVLYDPHLTLRGLGRIHDLNRPDAATKGV